MKMKMRKRKHPKSNEMRRITRMNYTRCSKGWWVRIILGIVITHGLFKDNELGGKRKALMVAKSWRDMTERYVYGELRPFTYGKPFRNLIQINNRSGKTGVFYQTGYVKGYNYPSWTATWSINGHNKIKRFYIHNYPSNAKAKQAAIEFRVQMEKKLERKNLLTF